MNILIKRLIENYIKYYIILILIEFLNFYFFNRFCGKNMIEINYFDFDHILTFYVDQIVSESE